MAPLKDAAWLDLPTAPDLLLDELESLGLSDGFPVVPPTPERMDAFLSRTDMAPDVVLGLLPPRMGVVTPAAIAANAIMAGCRAEWLPVIIAGLQAVLEPRFNLDGIQATTHPCAPLLIVHGAAARDLGFHGGAGLFGPGFRANATVGRAVRLCLMHIGGAVPGTTDRATHGQPSKFSYCIIENVDESPWEPYHVTTAGLDATDDAVTVFAAESPANVNNHVGRSAEHILTTIASTMTHLGANSAYFTQGEVFVVLSPEHAQTIADSGYSRADVSAYLFEHARQDRDALEQGGMWGMQTWPSWMTNADAPTALPPGDDPEAFRILVAGGPGRHSLVLQGFGASTSVTRRIATRREAESP